MTPESKLAVQALLALRPPKRANHESSEVYVWRWKIFGAVIALGGAFTVHILLACGFVPTVFGGFAGAGELRDLVAAVNDSRTQTLELSMLEMNEKYCQSTPGSEVRKLYLRLILERQKVYYSLRSQHFNLPGCESL